MRSRVRGGSQLQGKCDWVGVAGYEQAVSATVQQEQHQWLHGALCGSYAKWLAATFSNFSLLLWLL